MLVAPNRVVTCAHVVDGLDGERRDGRCEVYLPSPGIKVQGSFRLAGGSIDLAVIELEHPLDLAPAPIRPSGMSAGHHVLVPGNLIDSDRLNRVARATVTWTGARGGSAQIDVVPGQGYAIAQGHSGGPVIDEEFGAVIGICRAREPKSGVKVGWSVPVEQIGVAFPELAPWLGWRLSEDRLITAGRERFGRIDARLREARLGHWYPRAAGRRGTNDDVGRIESLFTGRTVALAAIREWIDATEPGVLFLTGEPGAGKSAVVARMVVGADPLIGDGSSRPFLFAFHAKDRSALDLSRALSDALGGRPDAEPEEVLDLVRRHPPPVPLVAIDGLDEAVGGQSTDIVDLAGRIGDAGAQVLIGARRSAVPSGCAQPPLDLDDENYFDPDDLTAYCLGVLMRSDRPDRANPWRGHPMAEATAAAIAARAGHNFLVGALLALACSEVDFDGADDPASGRDPGDGGGVTDTKGAFGELLDAVDKQMRWHPPLTGKTVHDALAGLAFAEEPGLPSDLWCDAVNDLAGNDQSYTSDDLIEARKTAADFLVQRQDGDRPSYRLFHQELIYLLRAGFDDPMRAESRFVASLLRCQVPTGDFRDAPEYLRRNIASHLDRIGRLDEFLPDPTFLLGSDPVTLRRLAAGHVSPAGARHLMALLASEPEAGGTPAERAARLRVMAELVGDAALAAAANDLELAFDTCWVHNSAPTPGLLITKQSSGWRGWTTIEVDQRTVIVAGNVNGTIRCYWADTGQPAAQPIKSGDQPVWALTTIEIDCRTVIVAGNADGVICSYWVDTSEQAAEPIYTGGGPVRGLTTTVINQQAAVVAGSADGTIRCYWVDTGEQAADPIHTGGGDVWALSTTEIGGRTAVVAGNDDGVIRCYWAETSQMASQPISTGGGWVWALTTADLGGRTAIVAGNVDGVIRSYWADSGQLAAQPIVTGGGHVWVLSSIKIDRWPAIIAGNDDGGIRRYWPDLRQSADQSQVQLVHSSGGYVWSLVTIEIEGRKAIAAGNADGVIRCYWADTGQPSYQSIMTGGGYVWALATAEIGGRTMIIAGNADGRIRSYWADTGAPAAQPIESGAQPIWAVATAEVRGGTMIVGGSAGEIVRCYWINNRYTATEHFRTDGEDVMAVTCTEIRGQIMVVTGSRDGGIRRYWVDTDRRAGHVIKTDGGIVWALTTVEIDQRTMIVAGNQDGRICFYWADNGQTASEPIRTGGTVWSLTITEIGGRNVVVAGNDNGGIHRFWADSGEPAGSALLPGNPIRAVQAFGTKVIVPLSGLLARLDIGLAEADRIDPLAAHRRTSQGGFKQI